jgi:hypothetical protein
MTGKDINRRIAAESSWSRTYDRSGRTRAARQRFPERFEREVEPPMASYPRTNADDLLSMPGASTFSASRSEALPSAS